jgi:hypothetical protein
MGKWTLVLSLVSLVGCSGKFGTPDLLSEVDEGRFPKPFTRPACEIQPAEYAINTDVVAFELETDNGFSMGWDLVSGFARAIQASFTLKTARLNLSMSLYDPIRPNYELTSVFGKSRLWNINFKFDLGIQQIGVGFNHYSQTPFSQLTQEGLAAALKNLTGRMAEMQDPWSTEVVAVPNLTQVILPVGSFTGLKLGDQFSIYNVEHVWEGVPCHSEHLLTRKTTTEPIATGEVIQLENSAALLDLVGRADVPGGKFVPVEPGAMVEVYDLKGNHRLYRTLQIGKIGGAVLQFDNSTSVNIGPYLAKQLHVVASRHGFIIYNP